MLNYVSEYSSAICKLLAAPKDEVYRYIEKWGLELSQK